MSSIFYYSSFSLTLSISVFLNFPLSLCVLTLRPDTACHTVQQMWEECCMCESHVLHWEVTLVILCKTLLELIDNLRLRLRAT